MATLPASGGFRVTAGPLQTALIEVGLTRTTAHGSAGVLAPLYLNPLEPAGSPSPFQPKPGRRLYALACPGVAVLKRSSSPPSVVGSLNSGRSKTLPVGGLASNLATAPL